MAPRSPRVVAELGRPETPDETAERKAESSRIYRSSQTARNLIAALIVTVAIVAVIIFAVPRGTPVEQPAIDVAAAAARVTESEGRGALSPSVSGEWIVNRASVDGDGSVRAWTIVYAPEGEEERGFLRVAQGFDADAGWTARLLSGAAPTSQTTIDGVEWDRYELDPSRTGNISVALSTDLGQDTVVIYGIADEEQLDDLAAAVSAEVAALREDAP